VNGGVSISNDIAGSSFQHPSAAHHAQALQFGLKQNALKQWWRLFEAPPSFFSPNPCSLSRRKE
jgi:hypothetical protein